MNVSINILFVAHLQHNIPQLLGRKFFRQFFHLPLTGLCFEALLLLTVTLRSSAVRFYKAVYSKVVCIAPSQSHQGNYYGFFLVPTGRNRVKVTHDGLVGTGRFDSLDLYN